MIDEDLKRRMEEAYLWGNKELALELSQKLDKQVAEAQNAKLWAIGKDPNNNNRG